MRAHFGLGDATAIEEVIVEWLSGTTETYANVQGNQFISITEGQGILGLNTVTIVKGISVYPNPVSSVLNIDKNGVEVTTINIYNTLGQLVLVIPNAQQTKSVDVSSLKNRELFDED